MPRSSYTPQDKKNMEQISINLQMLALQHSSTQTSISDALDIPVSTLNGYFKGTSLPTPGNVEKLSWFFQVKKSDIDPRFKEESTQNESSNDTERKNATLLAAHIDDDATEEEIQEILNYMDYVKNKRKK